jgi:uncharacterized membrane protein
MFQLPPVPTWDGLHPLIIHFPIALLLIAPLFILIGALLRPEKARPAHAAALLLIAMGTASIFVAVETGEAAGKLAERSPEINAILEHHEQLADWTRITFSVLTLVFAGIVVVPVLLHAQPHRIATTLMPLLFLALYLGAALLLINTAHNGGRLVHEFGVKAMVAPSPSPVAAETERGSD